MFFVSMETQVWYQSTKNVFAFEGIAEKNTALTSLKRGTKALRRLRRAGMTVLSKRLF